MAKSFVGLFVESKFVLRFLDLVAESAFLTLGHRFDRILEESAEICVDDIGNATQGFAGIMGFSQEWAKEWVFAVGRFYNPEFTKITRSPGFDEACVFGLFAGASRRNEILDEESELVENFLPDVLVSMIFNPWVEFLTKSFETNLSHQVKVYFRGSKRRKDVRLKSAMLLFERVLERMDSKDKKRPPQTPSRFGWAVLNQISYGVLGLLHPKERLELLYGRYAPLILPKEEAKK